MSILLFFFFSSRRRHTRLVSDWSSDVCSSDLWRLPGALAGAGAGDGPLGLRCARGAVRPGPGARHLRGRSEEHTSELQSLTNLVCRLLLEKKKKNSKKEH